MPKGLFPFDYTGLENTIANFVDNNILPSGRKAKNPATRPLKNFVFEGFELPDGTIVKKDILNRKQDFLMSCSVHPEADLFKANFRFLFDGSGTLHKTFCEYCSRDTGAGHNFTTYSELGENLNNDKALGWVLDYQNKTFSPDTRIYTGEYVNLKCVKVIPGTDDICDKKVRHTMGQISSALNGTKGHVVCQGECDSGRKNKDKRSSLSEFWEKVPKSNSEQWQIVNPDSWRGISGNYDFTHLECGHAIYRQAQSFVTPNKRAISSSRHSFGCPFCDRTSPLKLLNEDISRYSDWVSVISEGKVSLISEFFPSKDSQTIDLFCNTCKSNFPASQKDFLRSVHFGCDECSADPNKQRAWRLDDAKSVVSIRHFKLVNNPENYLKDANIISESGSPTGYLSVLDLCRAYPYTADGPISIKIIKKRKEKENLIACNSGKPYATQEIDFLKDNANKKTYRQMAKELGRTEGSVKIKFRKLGLENNKRDNYGRQAELNDTVFDDLSLEACYWAGLLAADGCITSGKNSDIKIELKVSDEAHLGRLLRFLQSDDKLSYRSMKSVDGRGLYASLRFRSKKIQDVLCHTFMLGPRKSHTLAPPKLINKKQIRAFMLGVYDGDGHIKLSTSRGLYCNVISASSGFIDWYIEQTQEITGLDTIKRLDKVSKDGKPYYQMELYCSQAERFLNSLYQNSPIFLKRKKQIFDATRGS